MQILTCFIYLFCIIYRSLSLNPTDDRLWVLAANWYYEVPTPFLFPFSLFFSPFSLLSPPSSSPFCFFLSLPFFLPPNNLFFQGDKDIRSARALLQRAIRVLPFSKVFLFSFSFFFLFFLSLFFFPEAFHLSF